MSTQQSHQSHDNSSQLSDGNEELPSFTDSDFYLNVDDVQLGPQIGQGAFSKVYLGRYLGELVAVKKQVRAEKDVEAYLLRELSVLKHYQHENLLQYIGASNVTTAGQNAVFIITELTEGGDLLALLLSEQPLGWRLRVSILLDAARALEYLHSKSLIHRDIKSPNMLLDKTFRCIIADFGMARQVGTNMTIVGTDAYMAPELMFDEPYGTAADMFSFGIVLWEAICRQKAGSDNFAERRPADRFRLDAEALKDAAPEDAPQSLLVLAEQLCEYEPDNRPAASDAFLWLEDLYNELPPDTVEAPPPIDFAAMMPPLSAETDAVATSTSTLGAVTRPKGASEASGGSSIVRDPLSPNSNRQNGQSGAGGSSMAKQRPPLSPIPVVASGRTPNAFLSSPGALGSPGSVAAAISAAAGNGSGSAAAAGSGGGVGGASAAGAAAVGATNNNNNNGNGGGSSIHNPAMRARSRSPSPVRAAPAAVGASHAPITRCGYLFKKGKSGLRNWQRRWFVLEGSRLIWYKDSKHYPREPRGFLELRGCFIVRGLYLRWKILSADATADQDDYNRELSARDVADMDAWLRALQEAIDGADTGEGPAGVILPHLPHEPLGFEGEGGAGLKRRGSASGADSGADGANHNSSNKKDDARLERTLSFGGGGESFRTDLAVDRWLESLGLSALVGAFYEKGYFDFVMLQEMGLTDEDLGHLGVHGAAQRKALKMAARGLVEPMLNVRVSGFFNFGDELVYRLDSEWRFLRASTFFRFQDFEDLHRKLKAAIKETKFSRLMPSLPQKPAAPVTVGVGGRGIRLGSIDHATTMARLQQALNKYVQKVVMLVGTREPFFTMLCGMLDLLPSDPSRLPDRNDEFLAKMTERVA